MLSFLLTLTRFFRGLLKAWSSPNFRSTLLITIILLVSGTSFYSRVEGWSIIDALYFCVMTLTTVGYGDLHPTQDFSKVFTMIYAVVGIGVFVALMTQLAQALLEKNEENTKIDKVKEAIADKFRK